MGSLQELASHRRGPPTGPNGFAIGGIVLERSGSNRNVRSKCSGELLKDAVGVPWELLKSFVSGFADLVATGRSCSLELSCLLLLGESSERER